MFDFFKSCILLACGNYFKIVVNVSLKQQICYNQCTMYIHAIMPCIHISTTHCKINFQLIFNYNSIDTISMATSGPLLKY